MRIGIECTTCKDAIGRPHYRLAPYFRGTAKQRIYSLAVISFGVLFGALLLMGLFMTDVAAKDAPMIDVTPKYGVWP